MTAQPMRSTDSSTREELLARWEKQHNTPAFRAKVALIRQQIEAGTLGEPLDDDGFERLKRSFLP